MSGVTMRAQVLSCCQPRPNSPQSSRCAFSRPIFVSVSRVHALAFSRFGEPVRRGPMPSIKRRGKLHHMRVVDALVANALVHVEVQRFGGRLHFRVGIGRHGRNGFGLVGGIKHIQPPTAKPRGEGRPLFSALGRRLRVKGVRQLVKFYAIHHALGPSISRSRIIPRFQAAALSRSCRRFPPLPASPVQPGRIGFCRPLDFQSPRCAGAALSRPSTADHPC